MRCEIENKQKMATRGKTWSDDEVQVMLGIWGDASVQRQLKGTVRNSHVFDKIVKELAGKGYKQCREKIKQLKKKYKEVPDSLFTGVEQEWTLTTSSRKAAST